MLDGVKAIYFDLVSIVIDIVYQSIVHDQKKVIGKSNGSWQSLAETLIFKNLYCKNSGLLIEKAVITWACQLIMSIDHN